MRKLIDAILTTPSLGLLTGAAASFFVSAVTGDAGMLLGLVGFLCGWFVYLRQVTAGRARGMRPNRAAQAEEYRQLLDEAIPARTLPTQIVRDHLYRREQLDRIFRQEEHIAAAAADTPGGISVATPEVLVEVHDLADQAYELSMRRLGLLRALRSTSEARLVWEYNDIRQRLDRVGEPARQELSALLAAKQEQIDAYRRLGDELTITEAQLDSIETFLNTLTYDQSITVSNVNAQIGSLKQQIAARKQAAEDVRRLVTETSAPPHSRSRSAGG